MMNKLIKNKYFTPVLVIVLSLSVVGVARAELTNNNANITPAAQNYTGQTDANRCKLSDGKIFGHAQKHWVSEFGNPTNSGMTTVSGGADDVRLQVNFIGHHCRINLSPTDSAPSDATQIGSTGKSISKSAANITGLAAEIYNSSTGTWTPKTLTLDSGTLPKQQIVDWNNTYTYSSSDKDRFYAKYSTDPNSSPIAEAFKVSGLSGLGPGTYSLKVKATITWVNEYQNGDYICVKPTPPPNIYVSDLKGTTAHSSKGTPQPNPTDVCLEQLIEYEVLVTVTTSGSVKGRVYQKGTNNGYAGRTINTCVPGVSATTDSNGYFSFPVSSNTNFCVRAAGAPPANATGPKAFPKSGTSAYGGGSRGSGTCAAGTECTDSSYEWQVSQADCYQNTSFCGTGQVGGDNNVLSKDRHTASDPDSGYDLVYTASGVASCPTEPDPKKQVITLPKTFNEPAPSGHQDGSSSPSNVERRVTTWTDYVSHVDGSAGGERVSLAYDQDNPGNPGSVRIDYDPYDQEYPFDKNWPVITYEETYTLYKYKWVSSTHYHDNNPANGGQDPGEPTHTRWDPVLDSTTTGLKKTSTVKGPEMAPCWPRTYNTTSIDISKPRFTPDREDPSKVEMPSATFNIQFGVKEPGRGHEYMRTASKVNNLPYEVYYKIRPSQEQYSYPSSGWQLLDSGNINIRANSTKQDETGSGNISREFAVTVERGPSDLKPGDSVCFRVRLNGTVKQGDINIDGVKSNTSNSLDTLSDSNTGHCSDPVVNWPYFKVLGNDVVSGGMFGSECSGIGNYKGISTYGRTSDAHRGSASQYGAFAVGVINGFTSAHYKKLETEAGANVAFRPFGLSFSNTSGGFGGNYAAIGDVTCLPNYFTGTAYTGATTITPANVKTTLETRNADSKVVEYFKTTGPVSLAGATVLSGTSTPTEQTSTRKVIFVDGTVTISNNIAYNTTTWNKRDHVPYVMIIAKKIVINANVTRIDGALVAQPDPLVSGSGVIETCNSHSFVNCRSPLTINGGLIAERVDFKRTRGSMRNGQVYEGLSNNPHLRVAGSPPVNHCSNGTATALASGGGFNMLSCVSEIVNFSPEIYLMLSQVVQPSEQFRLDSFVTLPPNF